MNAEPILERDIFISYAILDNESLINDEQGWVSAFDNALQKRLAQLLGRKVDIWRDQRGLSGNVDLDGEILDQFPKLKILITIISPRYLESEWCRKELHEFNENANYSGGVLIENKSRIFKVVKTPVPQDQFPTEISNMLGYNFFEIDDNDRFREFILEKGSPTYYKFIERFEDVAQDICKLIKMLDEHSQANLGSTPNPALTPDPGKTIYLAKTTSDLGPERDNIRRDLEKRGYCVLPDQELPVGENFRSTVADLLQRSKLAIHLIGSKYGVVPEDEQLSMVEIQYQLSQAAQLSRLIWMSDPNLSSEDERQQGFINALQGRTIAEANTDLLSGNMEDLKTVIIDTLIKLDAPIVTLEPSNIPRIYLIYDGSDSNAVSAIDDYLYDQGFEVLSPIIDGDENDIRKAHQDNLKVSDGVLIYCNQAAESWLKFKMNDLRKAPGYRCGIPLSGSAVYISGENCHFKERFRSLEAEVIKQFEAFKESDLLPFLTKLKKSVGESE